MKNKKTISVKFPTMLYDFYMSQLKFFGYSNKSEIITYLIDGLWKRQNGKKNSDVVNRILDFVNTDRPAVFSHVPHSLLAILLRGLIVNKFDKIEGFRSQDNLINALLEAFLSAKTSDKKLLRKEIHREYLKLDISKKRMNTYVSKEQYELLQKTGMRCKMNVPNLIHLTINLILKNENSNPDEHVLPSKVQELITSFLVLEGSTLSEFERDTQIVVYFKDDKLKAAIVWMIIKYEIPGWNEFLRRIVLFLLKSPNLIDLREAPEFEDESNIFSTKEEDEYLSLARKDFYFALYK